MKIQDMLLPTSIENERLETRKRIRYTINIQLILMSFFLVAIFIELFVIRNIPFVILLSSSYLVVLASMLCIRLGKWNMAINLLIIYVCININIAAWTANYTGYLDLYRLLLYSLSVYLIVNLIANNLSQFLLALGLNVVSIIVFFVIWVAPGLTAETTPHAMTTFIIGILTNVTSFGLSYNSYRFTRDIITIARHETSMNAAQLDETEKILDSTHAAFTIGETLMAAARSGGSSMEKLGNELKSIEKALARVNESHAHQTEINAGIDDITGSVDSHIEEQSRSISSIHSSLMHMMEAISNAVTIGEDHAKAFESLSQRIGKQQESLAMLKNGIQRFVSAAEGIQQSVGIIKDISERTNMLAMNASIEAARTGSLGKGFSIIAQEIRQLAESTRQGSDNIIGFLNENNESVRMIDQSGTTIQSVFTTIMTEMNTARESNSKMIESLKISGNEASSNSRELSVLVEKSGETRNRSQEARSFTRKGSDAARQAKSDSEIIEKEILSMIEQIHLIDDILKQIAGIGSENIKTVTELNTKLNEVQTKYRQASR